MTEYWIQQNEIQLNVDAFKNGVPSQFCMDTSITIPVAVHFTYAPTANEEACIEELVQDQIDLLNAAFDGTICHTGVTNAQVKFAIATQNHPVSSGISDGSPAITYNGAYGCLSQSICYISDWSGYLNIVVQDGNFIGLSPSPGDPTDPTEQGNTILISQCAFGLSTTVCANGMVGFVGHSSCSMYQDYDGGKNLVHQVGHFFNLHHTFCSDAQANSTSTGELANGSNCQDPRPVSSPDLNACDVGCTTISSPSTICDCDGVEDTAPQAYAEYGCPGGSPAGTASNPTIAQAHTYNNFMDYVDDDCMDCFTLEQKFRMMATICAINDFQSNVFAPPSPSGPTGPTGPAGPSGPTSPLGPAGPTAANVPTLGQWGVICLTLLMGIFGIVGVKQTRECT